MNILNCMGIGAATALAACVPISLIYGKISPSSSKLTWWNHPDRPLEVAGSIGVGAGVGAGIDVANKTFQHLAHASPKVQISATIIAGLSTGVSTAMVIGLGTFYGIVTVRY